MIAQFAVFNVWMPAMLVSSLWQLIASGQVNTVNCVLKFVNGAQNSAALMITNTVSVVQNLAESVLMNVEKSLLKTSLLHRTSSH